ncbi:hypothetical protein BH23CHL8_BH23CHL8_32180 [soil metagenome]
MIRAPLGQESQHLCLTCGQAGTVATRLASLAPRDRDATLAKRMAVLGSHDVGTERLEHLQGLELVCLPAMH